MKGSILFFGVMTMAMAQVCPQYECETETFPIKDESVCLVEDTLSNVFYARPCKWGYKCMMSRNSWTCQYPSDQRVAVKVAGTSCNYDQECVANNLCIKNVCVGLPLAASCKVHTDCDVGLFCSKFSLKCSKQIKIDEIGCTEDADCVNNAGCQIYSNSDPSVNVCTKYFSLDNYHALLGCSASGEINYLCESGFCMNIGMSVCYPAPKHKNPTNTCSTQNDCISEKTGQLNLQFFSNCTCGLNSERSKYCTLFPGDNIYNDYDDMVRNWIESDDAKKCNTYGRFGKYCMERHKSKSWLAEFTYKEYKAMSFAQVHNANECVLKTLIPEYQKVEEDDESSYSKILVLSLLLITI